MLQFKQQCILLDMQATNKESALKELAQMAVENYHNLDSARLYSTLLEREQIGSTGVGNGVAIPHGKVAGLKDIIFCFGRSMQGVNFEAIDNRPVYLFALLLSPAEIASEYLQALAHISNVLKQHTNRLKLLQVHSPQEIVSLFTPPSKKP
ncbi:PTS sugar transporter subunit IIA [Desulfogranum marinum]|uniref:PTS sugar transporter subunit IIA n=1 Tax=Desulfogranum marinum TaxID=453220 RepID=UPI0029C99D23|nr:PTS sugar transporter subunit IIA [Desulfogranum marinum]